MGQKTTTVPSTGELTPGFLVAINSRGSLKFQALMWSLSMPSSVAAKKLDLGRRRKGKPNDNTRMLVEVSKGDKHRVVFLNYFLSIIPIYAKGSLKLIMIRSPVIMNNQAISGDGIDVSHSASKTRCVRSMDRWDRCCHR